MIATSVNVPITGMYAVLVDIYWFLDRFRRAVNFSSDFYGTAVVTNITVITDPDNMDMVAKEEDLR